jgi:hypothetical protein
MALFATLVAAVAVAGPVAVPVITADGAFVDLGVVAGPLSATSNKTGALRR